MSGKNSNLDSPDKDDLSDSSDLPSFPDFFSTGHRSPNRERNKPDGNLETNEEDSAPETNEGVVSQPKTRARRSARIAEITAKYSVRFAEEKDSDSKTKRNSKQNSKKPVKRRLLKSAASKKSKPIHHPIEETDSDSNSELSVAVETSGREQEVRNRLNEVHREAEPFLNEIDNFEELEASNKYYYIEKSLMKLRQKLDLMSEDIKGSTQLISEAKEVHKYIHDIFARLDNKLKANHARLGDIEMRE